MNNEVNVPEEAVELFRESLWSTWGANRQTTDWPSRPQLQRALEAAAPSILSQERQRVREALELNVLCGELRWIAEKGAVPSGPSEHGLAVDVLTWAEGWLLQLTTVLNTLEDSEQPPTERLDKEQERTERLDTLDLLDPEQPAPSEGVGSGAGDVLKDVLRLLDRLELSSKRSADLELIGSDEFFATKDRLSRLLRGSAPPPQAVQGEAGEALEERLGNAEAELDKWEPVLVAADRLREAYDAACEGRDLGGLPPWEKGDIQHDQGWHHTQITTVQPPACQPEKGGEEHD